MARGDAFQWDDLRYFLRAAQCGTLAGAARAMGVEHSTIGRRLTALERALGAQLVLRGADGLRLTALGESLVPMVEDIERATDAVRERAALQPVRVRLALPSGFTRLFGNELARLRTREPGIALEFVSGSRPADLNKGEADLAIRNGPVTDPALVVRKLCVSGWSLYGAPAYLARRGTPDDPAQLLGHDLIGYDTSLATVPAARWVEARTPSASIVLRSREMTEMLAAAVGGAGLALLPCLIGDEEPGLQRLTPDVLATRELSLVYRPAARKNAPLKAAIDFIAEVIRRHSAQIAGTPSSSGSSPVCRFPESS